MDTTLGRSFSSMRPLVYRVRVEWQEGANARAGKKGTGCYIAAWPKSNRMIVCSAGHLLRAAPSDRPCDITLQQFDRHGRVSLEFRANSSPSESGHSRITYHKSIDIGFLDIPLGGDSSIKSLPCTPKVIDDKLGLDAGTAVAWAGYPAFLESEFLHAPQLCYFQGVVSATIDRDDCRYYLIDGHNMQGVSGAPVWWWNDSFSLPEVIGVVIGYCPSDFVRDDARKREVQNPGMCVVVPINTLVTYLTSLKPASA